MNAKLILGAIAGDIIGSPYEFSGNKSIEFDLFHRIKGINRFTDDTVLTIATMDCLVSDYMGDRNNYEYYYQKYGRQFLHIGFGEKFYEWLLMENPEPYRSFGNGAAMRVSPIAWFYSDLEKVLIEAEFSAKITHNHPEGIRGAQAIASSVFLAKKLKSKEIIKSYIVNNFGYNLNRTCDEIRHNYSFFSNCDKSVPESIICFLESSDYESAIRLAVSLGGDSDTLGAMTGSIAEAFYGSIPQHIFVGTWKILPENFKQVVIQFSNKVRINLLS